MDDLCQPHGRTHPRGRGADPGWKDSRRGVAARTVRSLDCSGFTITAGFWNSHVHFFERKWANAATIPGPELGRQLQDTLTQYGFTSVFDTGSVWENTLGLRDRITAQEQFANTAIDQLRAWVASGGTVLFGTDSGAIDYNPDEEYALMEQAGMSFRQVLASLTVAPAERFGESERLGRIASGFQADLVVLERRSLQRHPSACFRVIHTAWREEHLSPNRLTSAHTSTIQMGHT